MIKVLIKAIWVFYIVLTVFNSAISQKWTLGGHVGVTHAKMLWTTKPTIINQSLAFKYPETQFRTSMAAGLSADYKMNDKWYIPLQLDFYHRRFAVAPDNGNIGMFNDDGQWVFIQTDFLNFQISQLALSGGLGYKFIEELAFELQPYIHKSLTKQQMKIEDVIDWRVYDHFQQAFDFGISGYLRVNMDNFYFKGGYQYGLREIEEYTVFFSDGGFLGKYKIRNTMLLAMIGFKF
ncbi:MAG: hypothetical protein WAT46_07825 [Saprospiraceae bacterium]